MRVPFGGLSAIVLVTAVLVVVVDRTHVDPELFVAEQSGVLDKSPEDVLKFCGEANLVPRWFGWVSTFKEADKQQIGLTKKYQAAFDLPVLGEKSILMSVVDYVPGSKLVLESSEGLRPRFEILLERRQGENATKKPSSSVTLRLSFRNTSLLRQLLYGPGLSFLGPYQLQRSILLLRMMIP